MFPQQPVNPDFPDLPNLPAAPGDVENFIQGEIFADIFPNMPVLKSKKSIKKGQEELLSRLPEFRVIRSSRRKRTLHAYRQNGVIEIHIPDRLSRR